MISAADPLPTRRRALFDRITALDADGIAPVEHFVGLVESAPRGTLWSITAVPAENAVSRTKTAVPATPGAQRVVGGATITERPDLVYAGQVADGPVTAQAPEPEHPAELAKVGAARR